MTRSESEDRFRLLFDSTADSLFLHDLDGRFVEVNQAACDGLGYTREELLQLPLAAVVVSEKKEVRCDAWLRVIKGEKFTVHGFHRRKDGTTFPVEVHLGPFEYEGRPHILASARDITERKRAEAALAESEQRFSTFMDHLPAAAFVKDREGRLLFANRYLRDLFGWKNCLNKTTSELLPPEFAVPMMADDRRALTEGPIVVRERIIDLHGREFFFDTYKFPVTAEGASLLVGGIAVNVTERKQAEEALRESEKKYRSLYQEFQGILDAIPDSLCLLSPDLQIVWANEVAAADMNLVMSDFIGQFCYQVRHGRSEPCEECTVQKCFASGKQESGESTTPDGRVWELRALPLLGDQGEVKGVIEVARGITDRKHMEEALRESEARFRLVVESSPLPIGIASDDGIIEYINPKFAETFGYYLEDIPKLEDWFRLAFPDPDYREQLLLDWQKSWEEKIKPHAATEVREVEVTCKDGSTRIIQAFATLMGNNSLVVCIDLTERKRAEEALRESEARFRQVVESSPLPIAIAIEDGMMEYVNPKFVETFGYTLEDVPLLEDWYRLAYPDPRYRQKAIKRWQKAMKKAERQNRPTEIIEVEVSCKDGSKRIIDIFGTLVGKKTLGIFNDVTARKQAKEEQARLADQMREVQKLESLGLLAGGIAHDFNNLLMAILGNADLALLALSPASPARPNVEEIARASQRAADLCRQMLAYSGKGRFVVGRYDLTEIVREMAQMLQVTVSKKADLRYSFAADLPAVEVDATQMRQVIMNLITNASEAVGEDNGVISVATGVRDCDRAYLAASHLDDKLPEGRYVFLEVADTGCGLDEETRRRIFDPFFTTKFTGRGLGLAAVLGIVRGHRGAIKVASEPGEGTAFTILLPAVAWKTGDRTPAAVRPAPPRYQGTVLLIDDDAHVRRVAREMLERLGLKVLTAAQGQEGLEIFRARAGEIDCVLLDLTMPGMGGEEAFKKMRRLRHNVPVVLTSGYDEQDATRQFTGQGLAGFLQKPYTVAKLQEVLNRVLG